MIYTFVCVIRGQYGNCGLNGTFSSNSGVNDNPRYICGHTMKTGDSIPVHGEWGGMYIV